MTTATRSPSAIVASLLWALLFACLGPALGYYVSTAVLAWRWRRAERQLPTAKRENYEPFVEPPALVWLIDDLRREASCLPGRLTEDAARRLMNQAADALAALARR